jgi:hypothetical protein
MLEHATDPPNKAGLSVTWQTARKVIILLLAPAIGRFLVLGRHKAPPHEFWAGSRLLGSQWCPAQA